MDNSALLDALGVTALLAQFESLAERIEELAGVVAPPLETFSLTDTAKILGVTPKRVRELLADGRLWRVEGLDSADRVRIPRAAVEELLRRPS